MVLEKLLEPVGKNLWTRNGKASVPKGGLQLYAPLWHPELTGATFLSKDLNAHIITPTGTTKGIQGRTFNGISDYLTVPHAASIDPGTGSFSIIVWAKLTDKTDDRRMVTKEKASANFQGFVLTFNITTGYLEAYIRDDLSNTVAGTGSVDYSDSVWRMYGMTVVPGSATGLQGYVNGLVVTLNTNDLSTITSSLSTTADLFIGKFRDASGYFKGDIGKIILYPTRVLSAAEFRNLYQVTKWRYV